MVFWIKYYANMTFSWVFGYLLAWWFWGATGLVVAVAIFLLMPTRLSFMGFGVDISKSTRNILAGVALLVGSIVSAWSWGLSEGIRLERATWEMRMAQERLRLQTEAQENLKHEQDRASQAENTSADLKRQLDDLLAQASKPLELAVDAKSGKVIGKPKGGGGRFIPEPSVTRLRDLHGSR